MTLVFASSLTVLTETTFFALCGFRSRAFLAICVCVNTATNIILNLSLLPLSKVVDITVFVYILEVAVVAAEFFVYSMIERRSCRLFLLTIAANALSYGAGLLLFGHV